MKMKLFTTVEVLTVLLALMAVPAFAKEPMTISGVWLRENIKYNLMSGVGEKDYYYFSPGGVDGTAVGVSISPDILGGQQVIPFTGTWDFEEIDGKQLFCVYRIRFYVSGLFIASNTPVPGQHIYRFYSENGTQKMEFGEGDQKEIWTKIGTKLTDLPEVGVLAYEGNTDGKFWGKQGIVVK
jgi:hypothetical protein